MSISSPEQWCGSKGVTDSKLLPLRSPCSSALAFHPHNGEPAITYFNCALLSPTSSKPKSILLSSFCYVLESIALKYSATLACSFTGPSLTTTWLSGARNQSVRCPVVVRVAQQIALSLRLESRMNHFDARFENQKERHWSLSASR